MEIKEKAQGKYLADFFQNGHIYVVPNYQRRYTWDSETFISFVDDVLTTITTDSQTLFMGILITKHLNSDEEYLIDGQQRVTSFLILFKALIDHLDDLEHLSLDNEQLITKLSNLIYKQEIAGRRYQRLKLKNLSSTKDFNSLFEEKWKWTQLNNNLRSFRKTSLYHENYFLAREYLNNKFNSSVNNQVNFATFIESLVKVWVIVIELNPADDELAIFESINSKGTPLTAIELIKNFFFIKAIKFKTHHYNDDLEAKIIHFFEKEIYEKLMIINSKEQNKEFAAFIRKFIIYEALKNNDGKILTLPKEKEPAMLYNSFKNLTKKYFNNLETEEDFNALFIDLKRNLSLHHFIKRYETGGSLINNFHQTLYLINSYLTGSIIFPIVMQLADTYLTFDNNGEYLDIANTLFYDSIFLIEEFLIKRSAAGKGVRLITRTLTKMKISSYVELKTKIWNDDLDSDFSQLFVSNSEFNDALRHNSFGEVMDGPLLKALLWKIEVLLNTSKSNETINNFLNRQKFTIEHIMPKSIANNNWWRTELGAEFADLHRKYLNRFGNLTLSADNSKLSNSDFKTKKELYQKSMLNLNKQLVKSETWSPIEIDNRTEYLVNFIIENDAKLFNKKETPLVSIEIINENKGFKLMTV